MTLIPTASRPPLQICLLLNGPPSAGKSTAQNHIISFLAHKGYTSRSDSMAAPIKRFVEAATGMQYFAIAKDVALPMFALQTPREVLIDLSENFVKPRFGGDVFGHWAAARCAANPVDFHIFDDCGFQPEVDALAAHFSCRLIRLTRTGMDFADDSRSYLRKPWATVSNNTNLYSFRQELATLVDTLLDELSPTGLPPVSAP